jgi:DNA-directed RNA polymerase subunit E'/Rpb7
MVALFVPVRFKTQVQLKPSELDQRFEEHILYKLQTQYEGQCSRYGYIKPNSLTIVERSLGQLMKSHFNGHVRFDVSVVAEVCNPVEGTVITATVKNKNQMGILAESTIRINHILTPILDIIIPKRSAGISSEISLDALEIGDSVQVEILGKRYQLNDKKISIIGRGVETEQSAHQRRMQEQAGIQMALPLAPVDETWGEEDISGDNDDSDSLKPDDNDDTELELDEENEGEAIRRRPATLIEDADKSPFDDADSELDDAYSEEGEDDYGVGSDDDLGLDENDE